MSLNLQDKREIVAEVHEVAKIALSAVIVNYKHAVVDTMTKLRKAAHENGVYIRVIRNTLMRRIINHTDFECLKDALTGQNLIAFSMNHPGTAARLFEKFIKENLTLEIKIAAFERKTIPGSDIYILTSILTYKEAVSSLIFILKESSIGRLIRTIYALQNVTKIL